MNSFKTKQRALLIHGGILKKFQKKTFSTVSEEVLSHSFLILSIPDNPNSFYF